MCHDKSCWCLLSATAEGTWIDRPPPWRASCWVSGSCRASPGGSQDWQMRGSMEMPEKGMKSIPWGKEWEKLKILTWRSGVSRGKATARHCRTTKVLRCQTWDLSSSVELSAAVLKQTPQQEGRRPYPFSKIGERRLGGHEEFGTRHGEPAATVYQM